ncbi:hypothetical protein WL58_26530 [Burkholderia cepacia]|uniref:hypothetical protein n=1 Tax=Burkholderia cepacia TaxID=292 RepID=UPI00075ED3F7|nr:hypothetical protein [Burkholderia cepacia]KWC76724.1 hypothetical protein WL58_26530 [Burkholderia cepacia]
MSLVSMTKITEWAAGLTLSIAPWLASTAFAQATDTQVQEGIIGGQAVQLILRLDNYGPSLSGYVFEQNGGLLLPLEETPLADSPEAAPDLSIDVTDAKGQPFAMLMLRSFRWTDHKLAGDWVDLRSRVRTAFQFKQTAMFGSRYAAVAYDGDLLQVGKSGPYLFRVHAHKARGEFGGLVDRIDVYDRASGSKIQTLDHLQLDFNYTDTLEFDDYNGDGHTDFRASRLAIDGSGKRSTGSRSYFLFLNGRFRDFTPLDKLEEDGTPWFLPHGRIDVRQESNIDYRNRLATWNHYRFTSPGTLTFTGSTQGPMNR